MYMHLGYRCLQTTPPPCTHTHTLSLSHTHRSYSWSANVCGCKEWLLFPPGEEELLKDKFGHLPFDVTSRELENKELYPNVHKSRGPIRVVQRSGEIIFVPRWGVIITSMEYNYNSGTLCMLLNPCQFFLSIVALIWAISRVYMKCLYPNSLSIIAFPKASSQSMSTFPFPF